MSATVAEAPVRTARGAPKSTSDKTKAERKLAWLLCAPAVFVMLAVTAYPIGYAIYLSLLRADLRFPNDRTWTGLNNYKSVLSSSLWWSDLWHTVLIMVVSVAFELVLGMALALIMHRAIFGRGLVGGFVPKALGMDFDPLDPTHPFWNYFVVIATEVWKTTPFMALLLLAGLTLVPEELQEAARVDGASAWQRFWRITIPLMKPAILVALLFRTLDAFRIFDSAYIISNGPNPHLETVSILGYNQLLNRLNLGLGGLGVDLPLRDLDRVHVRQGPWDVFGTATR
jgi:multiple sugar transport system permease protein